jgi:acetyl esterase/lipase
MAAPLDPQIAQAMAALAASRPPTPEVNTALDIRAMTDPSLEMAFGRLPDSPSVEMRACTAPAADGYAIQLRWYTKRGAPVGGAAIVYAHGGGQVAGTLSGYDKLVRLYVERSGVPFLAVDYRLAPEFRAEGLGRDALAALQWLVGQAPELQIDPKRIALMGDSGGGAVAAQAAIMARDKNVPLKKQILIYPMLDDRNTEPDPHLAPTAFWSYAFNRISWEAVLGPDLPADRASPYLAPARLKDFAGLAPAYIEVGELDIFRDESVAYAQGLYAAGISCELHVLPGAPHGFEIMSIDFDLSKRAFADRVRFIQSV